MKPDAADSPYAQAEASLLDININIYTTFYSFRGGSPERLVTLLLLGHLSNLKLRPAVYRAPTISDFSQHLWGWGNNSARAHAARVLTTTRGQPSCRSASPKYPVSRSWSACESFERAPSDTRSVMAASGALTRWPKRLKRRRKEERNRVGVTEDRSPGSSWSIPVTRRPPPPLESHPGSVRLLRQLVRTLRGGCIAL